MLNLNFDKIKSGDLIIWEPNQIRDKFMFYLVLNRNEYLIDLLDLDSNVRINYNLNWLYSLSGKVTVLLF